MIKTRVRSLISGRVYVVVCIRIFISGRMYVVLIRIDGFAFLFADSGWNIETMFPGDIFAFFTWHRSTYMTCCRDTTRYQSIVVGSITSGYFHRTTDLLVAVLFDLFGLGFLFDSADFLLFVSANLFLMGLLNPFSQPLANFFFPWSTSLRSNCAWIGIAAFFLVFLAMNFCKKIVKLGDGSVLNRRFEEQRQIEEWNKNIGARSRSKSFLELWVTTFIPD